MFVRLRKTVWSVCAMSRSYFPLKVFFLDRSTPSTPVSRLCLHLSYLSSLSCLSSQYGFHKPTPCLSFTILDNFSFLIWYELFSPFTLFHLVLVFIFSSLFSFDFPLISTYLCVLVLILFLWLTSVLVLDPRSFFVLNSLINGFPL